DGLVDRVARPSFKDRIERLGAKRFDGEDERALLLLGMRRHRRDSNRDDSEGRGPRDSPEHKLLPKVDERFRSLKFRRTAKRLSVAPRKLVNSAGPDLWSASETCCGYAVDFSVAIATEKCRLIVLALLAESSPGRDFSCRACPAV